MTKFRWIGATIVVALAWCWSAAAQQYVPDPAANLGSRPLVTHFQEPAAGTNGPTVLTIVEPQTRVIAVYHISPGTGEIKLKSVRSFELDLRLTNFNGGSPTPEEIKTMFELTP